MSKKHRLSRDQRRKVKLEKKRVRSARFAQVEAAPYFGTKYQRDDLIEVYEVIERGIYNAGEDDPSLCDDDVSAALQFLVEELRNGRSFEMLNLELIRDTIEIMIVAHIVDRWRIQSAFIEPVGRVELLGVLRTLLGSVETRGEMAMSPRGYLDFLVRFFQRGDVF